MYRFQEVFFADKNQAFIQHIANIATAILLSEHVSLAVNVVDDAGVEEDAGVGAALGKRDAAVVAVDPADDARKDDEGELVFMLMNE